MSSMDWKKCSPELKRCGGDIKWLISRPHNLARTLEPSGGGQSGLFRHILFVTAITFPAESEPDKIFSISIHWLQCSNIFARRRNMSNFLTDKFIKLCLSRGNINLKFAQTGQNFENKSLKPIETNIYSEICLNWLKRHPGSVRNYHLSLSCPFSHFLNFSASSKHRVEEQRKNIFVCESFICV